MVRLREFDFARELGAKCYARGGLREKYGEKRGGKTRDWTS